MYSYTPREYFTQITELRASLADARAWLDELCGLIADGQLSAAEDWVTANAVSTDSTLEALLNKMAALHGNS